MSKTKIEWTEQTWNPVTGCTKTSPGCQHCYAEQMSKRHQANPKLPKYANGFKVTFHPETLSEPMKLRKSSIIFVCSMSDLFHKVVPDEYIIEVFRVMEALPQHIFQVLTKRSDRLRELAPQLPWPDNIWTGVSVENEDYSFRIDDLRTVPAKVRFVSFEPLLGPIRDIDFTGIAWAIVGGESGPGWRLMEAEWALDIRDQCIAAGVKFNFKQWAAAYPSKLGRELDGQIWDEMPDIDHPALKKRLTRAA